MFNKKAVFYSISILVCFLFVGISNCFAICDTACGSGYMGQEFTCVETLGSCGPCDIGILKRTCTWVQGNGDCIGSCDSAWCDYGGNTVECEPCDTRPIGCCGFSITQYCGSDCEWCAASCYEPTCSYTVDGCGCGGGGSGGGDDGGGGDPADIPPATLTSVSVGNKLGKISSFWQNINLSATLEGHDGTGLFFGWKADLGAIGGYTVATDDDGNDVIVDDYYLSNASDWGALTPNYNYISTGSSWSDEGGSTVDLNSNSRLDFDFSISSDRDIYIATIAFDFNNGVPGGASDDGRVRAVDHLDIGDASRSAFLSGSNVESKTILLNVTQDAKDDGNVTIGLTKFFNVNGTADINIIGFDSAVNNEIRDTGYFRALGPWPFYQNDQSTSFIVTLNQTPLVDTGSDRRVLPNDSVVLDDNIYIYDTEDDPLTYNWSCDQGTLSDSSILNPTYTAPSNNTSADITDTCTLAVFDKASENGTYGIISIWGHNGSDSFDITIPTQLTGVKIENDYSYLANVSDILAGQSLSFDADLENHDGTDLWFGWKSDFGNISGYTVANTSDGYDFSNPGDTNALSVDYTYDSSVYYIFLGDTPIVFSDPDYNSSNIYQTDRTYSPTLGNDFYVAVITPYFSSDITDNSSYLSVYESQNPGNIVKLRGDKLDSEVALLDVTDGVETADGVQFNLEIKDDNRTSGSISINIYGLNYVNTSDVGDNVSFRAMGPSPSFSNDQVDDMAVLFNEPPQVDAGNDINLVYEDDTVINEANYYDLEGDTGNLFEWTCKDSDDLDVSILNDTSVLRPTIDVDFPEITTNCFISSSGSTSCVINEIIATEDSNGELEISPSGPLEGSDNYIKVYVDNELKGIFCDDEACSNSGANGPFYLDVSSDLMDDNRIKVVVNKVGSWPIDDTITRFVLDHGYRGGLDLDQEYTCDLRVVDDLSSSYGYSSIESSQALFHQGLDSINITASLPDEDPTVGAGSDKSIGPGQNIDFDDATASDPEGGDLDYSWSCDQGTLSDSSILNPTYTAPDPFSGLDDICTLVVCDDGGNCVSDSLTVEENFPPDVNAGSDKTVNEGDDISFDDALSNDPEGDSIIWRSWGCVDSDDASMGSFDNQYTENPTYTAPVVDENTSLTCTYIVVDSLSGSYGEDSFTLTVQESGVESTCGNGVVEAGEECEPGIDEADCPDFCGKIGTPEECTCVPPGSKELKWWESIPFTGSLFRIIFSLID